MSDIIHLLPDSVANQIAAGEVVQRPASVVKELIENALDAHATEITISIIDAGRTSIQVTDNGIGMSETDARMAFERHATSKIRQAEDIFKILTMGFRGEALASIAAVSQTELKTKQKDNELGTKICISGSKIEQQEQDACPQGTTFTVKNLFFNTPARRKFMKSNSTEFNYILTEIYHTALANPNIAFNIIKDGVLYAKYPSENYKQRIISIFGKNLGNGLLPVEDNSGIVKIHGFVGIPDIARKNCPNQFFFVNNRFFRQKSFLGSILRAYGNLLPPKEFPPFFIFLDINPDEIDINIHPTKTEIKFSEEFNICQLLEAAVKYTLGKNNIVPSFDFKDANNYSDMFSYKTNDTIKAPELKINPNYNPFKNDSNTHTNTRNWEKLFENFESGKDVDSNTLELNIPSKINNEECTENNILFCTQFQKKYIIAYCNDKIYIIDIKRAHYRLLYDRFLQNLSNQQNPSQKTLLPARIDINSTESEILKEIIPQLNELGFDIEEFGSNSFVVNGAPCDVNIANIQDIILDFVNNYSETNSTIKESKEEQIARNVAKSSALFRNPSMNGEEMKRFVQQVIENESFSITPDGQIATVIISLNDIIKNFN